MELSANYVDHPKEYYYKPTVTGRKTFYKRTDEGHKRVARANIPPDFIDRIALYNEDKDADLLKYKKDTNKKLERATKGLKNLDFLNLSPKNFERSKKVLEDRIKSAKIYVEQCDQMNSKYSEERYKEETRKGFKNYFEEKYEKYEKYEKKYVPKKVHNIQILKDEKIMENDDEDISIIKRRWKRWLVFNHPDKGGDEQKCVQVINAFKYVEEIRNRK